MQTTPDLKHPLPKLERVSASFFGEGGGAEKSFLVTV